MQIVKAKGTDFDFIFSKIESNFIPDERREYDEALRLFKEGRYEIYHLTFEGKKLGFITLWQLPEFTFAEHLVIYEEYRNSGYGREALLMLQTMFPKIVLETEEPVEMMQKRRLAFYKRCGFFQNERSYLQPSYREDGNEVPLVIMSYPMLLDDFDAAVKDIYEKVYFKKYRTFSLGESEV